MFSTLQRITGLIIFRIGICLLAGLTSSSAAAADLPRSVASRVVKINTCLEAADQALDADRLQTAQRKLKDTQRPLKEIENRYRGKFDEKDPVYRAMLERLAAVTARVKSAEEKKEKGEAAGAAEAASETLCREWIDRLDPLVDRGSESCLLIGADLNRQSPGDQERCKAAYRRAKVLFEEYRKAEFPHGKSFRLQGLEEDLGKKLKEFPAAMPRSQEMMSGDVGEQFDRLLRNLDRDDGWKSDETKKPPVMMERTIEPLRKAIADFASTADASDPRLVELRGKPAAIDDRNAEYRAIRAQRTFQLGYGYRGADLATLKEKTKAVAAEAYPGAKLHEITVPGGDWAIEDIVEFTDTSRTALRHRLTRSVRAQVSLKAADGAVWLQEVYLGQDQRPDGGWGALKGHTTWTDPMVQENLGKITPAKK